VSAEVRPVLRCRRASERRGYQCLLDKRDGAPSIVVDCSTVSAEASQHVREQLAARGSALLAAPVMGNPRVARAGKLTLAVSGSRADFDAVAPYLSLLGAGATYVGGRRVDTYRQALPQPAPRKRDPDNGRNNRTGRKERRKPGGIPLLPQQECHGSQFTRYKSPAFVSLDFGLRLRLPCYGKTSIWDLPPPVSEKFPSLSPRSSIN